MGDLITSISTAISIAKRLNEIGKNIQDAEFKNLLADLSLELADTKLKLSEVVSENAELKQEISQLKNIVKISVKSWYSRIKCILLKMEMDLFVQVVMTQKELRYVLLNKKGMELTLVNTGVLAVVNFITKAYA